MKRTKTLVVTFLTTLLLCCAFVLAGCSGKVAGTYKFYSMTMEGMSIKVGEDFQGVAITEDFATLTLEEDGTAKLEMSVMLGDEAQVGTWKEVDGKIEITMDGDAQLFELDGDTLTYEFEGNSMIFKK